MPSGIMSHVSICSIGSPCSSGCREGKMFIVMTDKTR